MAKPPPVVSRQRASDNQHQSGIIRIMAQTKCEFESVSGEASGCDLLAAYGPTLLVHIGFDPNYRPTVPNVLPVPGLTGIHALVEPNAAESCIDSLLASQLNLPIAERRLLSGVHGSHTANRHLAQVYIPSLNFTISACLPELTSSLEDKSTAP